MPLSPSLDKMTRAQLEARIAIHETTAENMELHREEGMAREFRDLAQKYRTELDTRPPDLAPPARKHWIEEGDTVKA